MALIFSDRIKGVPRSFLREILKSALRPEIISFAGGLPASDLFPVNDLAIATAAVMSEHGPEVLQYTSSEGYQPLREWIAERYARQGLEVSPDDILITTGSQQGLDLLGKVMLNEGDPVAIEEPGYFGAIQAWTIFQANWLGVPVNNQGVDIAAFRRTIEQKNPKLFYCVPNFQNPSGISYDEENRVEVTKILQNSSTLLIEDDPYGDLRFHGSAKPSFKQLIPAQTVLLGSFSKIIAPSLRVGWLVAEGELQEKLLIAKQAADLHTPYINQRILHRYLSDNNIDEHIASICQRYGAQCQLMLDALQREFSNECQYTRPEGGMFLGMTLPEGMKSMELFEAAIAKNVAFVPGNPFYFDERDTNKLRLNFTSSTPEEIEEGVQRLAVCYRNLLD